MDFTAARGIGLSARPTLTGGRTLEGDDVEEPVAVGRSEPNRHDLARGRHGQRARKLAKGDGEVLARNSLDRLEEHGRGATHSRQVILLRPRSNPPEGETAGIH